MINKLTLLNSQKKRKMSFELNDKEKEIVSFAMNSTSRPLEILQQKENESITRESMHSLQDGERLVDEVVNYYLYLIANRDEELSRVYPSRRRNHVFTSFFMTKLLNQEPQLIREGRSDQPKVVDKEVTCVKSNKPTNVSFVLVVFTNNLYFGENISTFSSVAI